VKMLTLMILTLIAAVAAANAAQPDELGQNLFPPDQVLRYRDAIGLDDRQSEAMKKLLAQAQSGFVDLQWDLQDETGKLARLLRSPRVDEAAALTQVDRVLSQEREVKKAQLTLLIRIKNLLTPEQQQKLSALREKSP
jgi:Spy/CpxP family protein refolding chaperone